MLQNLAQPLDTTEGFARAYREHSRRAFAAALRVLGDPAAAEDVVQDVFISLWRKPDRYDARRGPLGAYVAMMARSRALDRVRSNSAERHAVERVAEQPEQQIEADIVDLVVRRESTGRLLEALADVAEPQRTAVVAFACGVSGAELARQTAVPLGTAKSRIRHGLIKTRAALASAA